MRSRSLQALFDFSLGDRRQKLVRDLWTQLFDPQHYDINRPEVS